MSSADSPKSFDAVLIQLRVVHVALLVGVLAMLGVAISQRGALPLNDVPMDKWTSMTYVMVGGAVVALVAAYLLPSSMQATARMKAGRVLSNNPAAGPGDDTFWLTQYRTLFLTRAALFEAGALALALNYLLEGLPLAYWGAWLFVIAFLLYFPTAGGLRTWIDTQRELVKQERS
jgi:hypothetical protein